ncbi:MAG: polyprenol phosphomannose-dependent alpha 1,6 mannosyltransferase MptB [Acidimicrobiales bacterium]
MARLDALRDRLGGPSDAFAGDRVPNEDLGTRGMVLRPALVGFVAVLAVAIGASIPSSPFKLEMPGVWFFGEPATTIPSHWGLYFSLAAVYGGLLLFMRVWWGMLRLYRTRGGVPVKAMMGVFGLWSLPVLVIAPLFSRDLYSYAAQGEMVSHHMNPYLYGPFELGNNAYTAPVDSLWGNAPAPYGPLFLQIDGFFARITFHNELATIVLLRLLALVGVLLIAACVPKLAKLYHRDGAELFTLMVLNPVTIFHLIGGGHNDALMLGLLVAGHTMAKEKRPIVGIVLCALATAIKAPAAIGIVYIGWSWLGRGVPVRDRIRPVVTAGLVGLGILGFFSYVSGLGWGWVTILGTPGAVRSWASPMTALAFLVSGGAHLVHVDLGVGGVLSVCRFLGMVVAAVSGAWLLFNSDRIGTLKALAITLLLFVLLGPVVQPWYLSWGLVLLAPVALGQLRSLVIGLSMVTGFVTLPGGSQLVSTLLQGDPLRIVLTLLWLLAVLTVPLSSWDIRSPATAVDTPTFDTPTVVEAAVSA